MELDTHNTCNEVRSWDEVMGLLQELGNDISCLATVDSVEVFIHPRLCEKCLEHAAQPLVFGEAKHLTECQCWMHNVSCGVHDRELVKGG